VNRFVRLPDPLRLFACLAIAAAVACGGREDATDRGTGRGVESPAPPSSARSLANQPAPANRDEPRIVVLGDSLTAGLGLAPHEAYPALLQERVREKGLKYLVINAGNSGDTSAAGLARLDLALEGDVRVLVVALGGNDGLRGLPVTQLQNNLGRIIEGAQARGITVVLAGMQAPTNWGIDYTQAFRDVYPSLSKKYRVALVPFLLEGVAGIDRLNQRDRIHPTAEGDRIIAETVWTVLEPIVTSLATPRKGAAGS
jgi:acyl-CoA thioesterase-1